MSDIRHRVTQILSPPAVSTTGRTGEQCPTLLPQPSEYRRIGRYELIYHIASGGMASVFAGRLKGLAGFERLVAVKIIHPHLAHETSFIRMFLDEARIAARIHHPNVAEIFEVGEEDGLYYMVGELILGRDLAALAQRAADKHRSIEPTVAARITLDICRGLHEAHELTDDDGRPLHLVHRDVSSRNILVSYRGYPSLVDFGVALARGRLSQTTDRSAKGKIGYMPPEQLRGEPLDQRADIFSLGVVLYGLATGQHPFPYESEAEQIQKVMTGEFVLPGTQNPNVPQELETIILKAMAHSPSDRYENAAKMGADLDHFIQSAGGCSNEDLARLMEELFAAEIADHAQKLRRHRSDGGPENSEPRFGTAVADPAVQISVRSKVNRQSSESRNLKRSSLAVIVLFVAAALFIAGNVLFRQKTGAVAISPLSLVKSQPLHATAMPDPVTIDFVGLVSGARVFMDGKAVRPPVHLHPSTREIPLKISAPGHLDWTGSLRPSRHQTLYIQLLPAAFRDEPRSKPVSRRRSRSQQKASPVFEENPFD